MATPTHFKIVGIWLNDLFALVAGQPIEAQAKTKIATIAALLAEDFPHETTFGRESLVAMAREFKFFPAYSELVDRLNAWWAKNKPASASLPGENLNMPAADRAMVMFWNQYRTGERKFDQRVTIEGWLSMIRKPTPAAFAYLTQTDNLAAEIAVKAGWITGDAHTEAELAGTWTTPEGVEKSLAGVLAVPDSMGPMKASLLKTLRAGVEHYAPEHLHLLPEALSAPRANTRDAYTGPSAVEPDDMASTTERASAQFVEKHGRKPGQLSPEQLEAVRQRANGPRAPANDPKPPKSNMEPTNFFEL